ncbi:MAG: very short patch repair endonuclease [Verrucomicrobiota bacterium]
MAAVKGRGNKTTERKLRFALVGAGICGWEIAPKDVLGHPDFYFRRDRIAIFVDGCFWHGCPRCGHIPRNNRRFWQAKIQRNRLRDRRTAAELKRTGVRVLRLWEHELCLNTNRCMYRIIHLLNV